MSETGRESPLARLVALQHVLDSTSYSYPWSGVAGTSRDGGWWWRCTCGASHGSFPTQEAAEADHPGHREAALLGAATYPWLRRGDLVEVMGEDADGHPLPSEHMVGYVAGDRVYFAPSCRVSARLRWLTRVNGRPIGLLLA